MALVEREEVLEELGTTEGFGERTFQLGVTRSEFSSDEKGNMLFSTSNGSVHEYKLSRDAFIKASRLCGIPETYVSKFPDTDLSLLSDHLNYWFSHRDDDMKMLLKGDTVVSFLKPTTDYYSRTHLFEMAERILNTGGGAPLLYDHVHNSLDKGLHYAIISQKQAFMQPGDLVRGGIQVQDHILGELPMVVTGYVWRQVCGNGMLSKEILSKYSRKSDISNLDEWFTEAVTACNETIEEEFARTRHLQDVPIERHGADILHSVFSEFKVSPAMRGAITDNVVNEGADTLYDIVNAITAAANNEEFSENPQMIRTLQSVAGHVAAEPEYCPRCFSLVRSN
jgi:hypothetical protein